MISVFVRIQTYINVFDFHVIRAKYHTFGKKNIERGSTRNISYILQDSRKRVGEALPYFLKLGWQNLS